MLWCTPKVFDVGGTEGLEEREERGEVAGKYLEFLRTVAQRRSKVKTFAEKENSRCKIMYKTCLTPKFSGSITFWEKLLDKKANDSMHKSPLQIHACMYMSP